MFKFLIGFLILFAGSNFSCFASGVDDFNKKRFDSAFRALWPDAEAGQASAMFYIGRIYMEGLGSAPKDTSKGMSYITRSADKGFEPAIKIVAQSAERSGNLKVALNYYEKLKDRGDISSIEKIAEINEKLFGKDRELTASYCNSLESSKILNKSFNEFRYAECITSGKLSGRNIADAVLIYKKLAESGDLQSLQALIP
jgi:TPR repeat protein